jgi:Sel1 repeat-containing protein
MPLVRVVPFVVTGVALSLSIVAAAMAQPAAAPPQLPTVSQAGFRVDVATGALTPLEVTKATKEKRGGYVYCYLEGASSPVTFRHDEPLAIAYRFDASRRIIEDVRKEVLKKKSTDSPYELEFLSVSDSGRRYGTGKFVPMDRELYGEIVSGVNPEKEKDVGQSFLFKPRWPPAPGEYALVVRGLVWKAVYGAEGASCTSFPVSAFRIVEGGPVTQQKPPPLPAAPSSQRAAAPTNSASDIERLRRGAEQGDVTAQFSLGSLHFFGRGVLQDYVEAHKWLNIAAARLEGDDRKQCVELRDKVAGLMTPVQLAEAQKQAVDWVKAFEQMKR